MKKKSYLLLFVGLLCFSAPVFAQEIPGDRGLPGLVPLPLEVNISEGQYTLPAQILVYAKTSDEINVAQFFQEFLQQIGRESNVSAEKNGAHIQFLIDERLGENHESYKLEVDEKGIRIMAPAGAGLFYGMQTLSQLFPNHKTEMLKVPYVHISDEPALKWRGSMLDVARHFFPVSFIKKYIDFISAYKINTFHWHLTDDQGWRIEIKKYPKLTSVSAFRKETLVGPQQLMEDPEDFKYDGIPYGGFYTQEEIKEVVAYAQKRYVTIVPEIEMPGHTSAVLAAYPELACKPGDYEVATEWGVFEDIVCPSEETFVFFENVLSEVVALFPGEYVHIGGDEAPKARWKDSKLVQKIMKKEKIDDVEKVQGWFNQRIEKFLNKHGKKLVGWDEILDGGITPGATVMSWRGIDGGIAAAKHGNDVVMAPTAFMYLDYGQNPEPHNDLEPLMICCYVPMEKVYSFNPIPEELTPEQHKHIIGVQANLWTEYITTGNKVEYMLFPRFLAFSEVAWMPSAKKNYDDFIERVSDQFPKLDLMGINYRIPEPTGFDKIEKKDGRVFITLASIVPDAEIRYTLDGEVPDETTHLYKGTFSVPEGRNLTVKAVTIAPNRRHSVPATLEIP